MKLEQSAFRLKVEPGKTITDIGLEYGYCASNYSQAFRKYHKESPIEFRGSIRDRSLQHPFWEGQDVALETFAECNAKVSIKEMDDIFVAYERVIGNYGAMAKNWCDFTEKYKDYRTKDTLLIERTFDDPTITDTNKCLYDLCMSVPRDCGLENTYVITGGRFAVYAFAGYPKQIYTAYQSLFNVWLPQTGHRIDHRYGFDLYHRIDDKTMYMELDICIPIEG